MDNTVGSLSQLQRSIVLGSLLGDGYLRKLEGRKDAFLEINHSFEQKDYVDWKYEKLSFLSAGKPNKREGNGNRVAYRFYTKQHPFLTETFNRFYSEDGTKVIPKDLELNPLVLSVWFMDDGSKSSESDFYLNTQQFSVEDQKILIRKLSELGLESNMNKDKKYYRIRLFKRSIPRLRDLVEEYVIPSLRYKIEK